MLIGTGTGRMRSMSTTNRKFKNGFQIGTCNGLKT